MTLPPGNATGMEHFSPVCKCRERGKTIYEKYAIMAECAVVAYFFHLGLCVYFCKKLKSVVMYKIFFFLLILSGIVACTPPQPALLDIESFYFPVADLDPGRVYEYETADDPRNPPFYYYYRNVRSGGVLYLTGTYYDYNFTPIQFVREEVKDNGMILSDFYFYHTDTLTQKQSQVPVEIVANNVFPFTADEQNPGVLLFTVKWNDPEVEGTEFTLIRNRQFAGNTTYVYQGKEYDAVKFYVRELIDNYNEGHLETEYDGLEIYAEGLGLVYFEKNISEEFQIKYKLKDTYAMEVLEEKFKERE